MMRLTGFALVLLLPCSSPAQTSGARPAPRPSSTRVETYESAVVDASGRLHLTTSDHRNIVVPKARDQTSFEEPMVSQDRTAVGAQADFKNCCTSYDIPLQLVVYANGRVHRFTGNELPIFQWHFADAGTRVAYGQEPVHFGCAIHYELRDIRSERLIDSVDVPEPCGQDPDPPTVPIPEWVKDLNAARK